jgi:abortive infection bacteriophage resistance protein
MWARSLFFDKMNLMNKSFLEIEEQIELLKSRKLEIKNEDYARTQLLEKNYYNLINSYKEPFIKNDSFEGSNFEEIVNLYVFDQKLRALLLNQILNVEEYIKALTAFYFSEMNKDNNVAYLLKENFLITDKNKKIYSSLSKKIKVIINPLLTKEDHIKHYLKKYDEVPFWVLAKSFSIGTLSSFLKLSKQKLQQKVAVEIGIREDELITYLAFLTLFRNESAHNKRIYSLRYRIQRIPTKQYPSISTFKNIRANDLFSILLILKRIITKKNFDLFMKEFEKITEDLSSSVNKESYLYITNEMGLPKNWREIKNI